MIEFLNTTIEGVTVFYIAAFALQCMCLGFIIGIHAYERMIQKLDAKYSDL